MISTIIHLSDIHIRAGDSDRARYKEYLTVFDRTFSSIEQQPSVIQQKALIVVTGDLFHHKNKLEPYGLELAIHFLTGLSKLAPVYIIRGNHDYRQDVPHQRDMISALMGYSIPRVHYLDSTGLYTHDNVTFGLVAIQNTLLYGATSGITNNLPDFPVPPSDSNYHIALFHGSITGSTLQNGSDVSGPLHGYPIEWFKGYDAILLGDIHLQQVHRAREIEITSAQVLPHTVMRQTYAVKKDTGIPWGYPGSLLQQDMGEPLLGHGYIAWDLENRVIQTFHVTNDNGYAKLRVLDDGKTIEILHRASYSLPSSYVPLDDVILAPWFPRSLSIVITGKNNNLATLRYVSSYMECHRINVLRINAAQYVQSLNEAVDEKSDASDLSVSRFQQINSIDRLIEYIQSAMNHTGRSFDDVWLTWLKHPEQMFLPIDGLPDTLVQKLTEKSDKLMKFITKYNDDFEKFQTQNKTTMSVHLHKVEWSWILNFKDGNVFDFDKNENCISILNAKNGYGKSNFLEVICIALFGEGFPSRTSRSYSAGLICDKKPSGVLANTSIVFTIQSVTYILQRTWKVHPDKRIVNPVDIMLYRLQPSTHVGPIIVHQGQTAVSAWIKSIFGSIQTYHMSAMLSQNADSDFFTLDRASQRILLDQILSLDHINSLQALFKEVGKYYKSSAELIESYQDGIANAEYVSPNMVEELDRTKIEYMQLHSENQMLKSKWNMYSESILQSHTESSIRSMIESLQAKLQRIPNESLQNLQDELAQDKEYLAETVRVRSSLHAFSDLDVPDSALQLYKTEYIDTYSEAQESIYTYCLSALPLCEEFLESHPYYGSAAYPIYEPMSSIIEKRGKSSVSYDSLTHIIREFETWDAIQMKLFAEHKIYFENDVELQKIVKELEQCNQILQTEPNALEQATKKCSTVKRRVTKLKKEKEECMMNRPNKPMKDTTWLTEMKVAVEKRGDIDTARTLLSQIEHARSIIPDTCSAIRTLTQKIIEHEQYLQECESIPFNPRCKSCKQQSWRTKYETILAELPVLRESLGQLQRDLSECSCPIIDGIILSIDTYKSYMKELDRVFRDTSSYISSLELFHKETALHTEYNTWSALFEKAKHGHDTAEMELRTLEDKCSRLQKVIQHAQQDKMRLQSSIERVHARKTEYDSYCVERVKRKAAYDDAVASLTSAWYYRLFDYRCTVYHILSNTPMEQSYVRKSIAELEQKITAVSSRDALLKQLENYTQLAQAIPHWSMWQKAYAKEQKLALRVNELETQLRGKSTSASTSFTTIKRLLVSVKQNTALVTYLESVFDGYRAWLYKTHISVMIHDCVNRVLRLMCTDTDQPLMIDSEWLDTIDTLAWFIKDGTHRVIIEKASGFQRFIVGIAIRVAFHQIGFCRVRFHQMFIDEGFTACDADHLERVPSFLNGLLHYYNSIYLVTHLEDLKSSTSHHIYIKRDLDQLSRIQHGDHDAPLPKQSSPVTSVASTASTADAAAIVPSKRRGRPAKNKTDVTITKT